MTKDVPDHALMLGNPGKIAGWVCECGHHLNFQDRISMCDECGKLYRQTDEDIKYLDDELVMQQALGRA